MRRIRSQRPQTRENVHLTGICSEFRIACGEQPFQFVPVHDLKYREPDYIIDELFETETLGLLFGDPGCGKSFLAVDIALAVASGTQFHGRDVKQGSVFFIAGEGHNGLARRFAAWAKARDVSLAGGPLFKSERAAQFLDGASAKAVADAVASLAKDHGQPTLIIIDTLARNFGAGDENNTKDMSEFVVAVDDLKARFPGCAVLIVHHSGHAEKQRCPAFVLRASVGQWDHLADVTLDVIQQATVGAQVNSLTCRLVSAAQLIGVVRETAPALTYQMELPRAISHSY